MPTEDHAELGSRPGELPAASERASLDATLALLALFGDGTRIRLMSLLIDEELTVAELVAITGVPQSRVSTHLGRLKDAGLLRDRRVGASTFYAARDAGLPPLARRVWELVRASTDDPLLDADRQRRAELLAARTGEASWPDTIAGEMDRYYSPGRTWEATARGLIELFRLGDVLDVGSGDGVIAALLAPRAESTTCLDRSEKMIAAARKRLAAAPGVRFVVGDMHELPFPERSFDVVLLFNTLTYSHHPARALAEAGRVLRPGGTLVAVTLNAHEHTQVTAAYSHLNAGFSPETLTEMLRAAGLEVLRAGVTSRERQKPWFEVVTASATRPDPARTPAKKTP
ncbi:MAG: metalloregulator ArsR/SmtB family transcription factor [Sorangiineae bacterium]|nr:metalloregulator ArsR/SmtB family transcription factor [Polyangiaceae bacterium]MEB2322827.1 metalloregulator ArsR/SmtB family transcription factor [Sorangiineae bacterium]